MAKLDLPAPVKARLRAMHRLNDWCFPGSASRDARDGTQSLVSCSFFVHWCMSRHSTR